MDYRPRPGADPTAVTEDLANLPPVEASISPSLRSTIDTAAALLIRTPQRSCTTRQQSRRSRLIDAILLKDFHSGNRRKPRRFSWSNREADFHETTSVWATDAAKNCDDRFDVECYFFSLPGNRATRPG